MKPAEAFAGLRFSDILAVSPRGDEAVLSFRLSPTETLVSSPHIAAKLGQMSRALRICFDSEDWGEVIWERYLP